MKAYLVGGPANGRVVDLTDSTNDIVMPVTTSLTGFYEYNLGNPSYERVVYRKSFQLRNGGYVFEVDEAPKPEPKFDFGKELAKHLRTNPGALDDTIRRAVRGMNPKLTLQ